MKSVASKLALFIDNPFSKFIGSTIFHYDPISRKYFKQMFTVILSLIKFLFLWLLVHISLFDGLDFR